MAHPHLVSGLNRNGSKITAKRLIGNVIAALAVSTNLIAPAEAVTESVICSNAPKTLTAQVDLEVAFTNYVAVRINLTNISTNTNALGAWRVVPPGVSVAQSQGFNVVAGSGLWYTWAEFFVYNNGWYKASVRYIPVLAGGADFSPYQYYCRF